MKTRKERNRIQKNIPRIRRPFYFLLAAIFLVAGIFGTAIITTGSAAPHEEPDILSESAVDTVNPDLEQPETEPPVEPSPQGAETQDLIPAAAAFTVEFSDWDNTPLGVQSVAAGQSASAPASPSREGYAFTGWDTDFSNVQSNMTVRAVYDKLETFTVTIRYLMPDGKTAAQPYIAVLPKGETLQESVSHPPVSGYVPQPEADYAVQDTETYSGEKLELNIQTIAGHHTYTVEYIPHNMTQYKVHYHLPKLPPQTGYDIETRVFTGATGEVVQAPAEDFTGFSLPASLPEATLAADGSTEMDVYCSRKTVTLFFDTAGGSYIEPISGLFGSAVTAPADPQKLGSTFDSWDMEVPATMPGDDLIFTAQWDEADTANYTIKYWLENPDDAGYSFLYGEVREGKVGQGYGVATDDLQLDSYSDFWAPAAYYQGMPAGATNAVYKNFYYKNTGKIAEENEGVKITSDGTAEFNVYHTRLVTEFTFDIGSDYYVTHDGTRYDGSYSFSVKFGANVSTLWPSLPKSDNQDVSLNFDGYISDANRNLLLPVIPRSNMPALIICYKSGNYYEPRSSVTLTLRTTTRQMVDYYVAIYVEPVGGADNRDDYDLYGNARFYIPEGARVVMSPVAGFGPPDPKEFTGVENAKSYFERLQYKIDFYSGGQKINAQNNIWYQEKLAPYDYTPNAPPLSMPGYTFGGWYTSSTMMIDETKFDFENGSAMPPADLTLYAKWEKPVFDVHFAPNNGGDTITQQYEYGDFITLPTAPEKDGYRFMGWRESDKDYLYMFSNPVVRNLELVAVWEPVSGASYTVRYIDKANNAPLESERFIDGKQPGSTVTETAREISGFLPDYVSKSITLGTDGKDVITFYYSPFDTVEYTVNYQGTDGKELKPSVTKSTGNTIVTENFVHIPGYYPVVSQVKLQLSIHPTENTVTFQYIKSGDVPYTVEHYLQNVNGVGYYPHPDGADTLSAPAGANASPKARTVAGFTLNTQASDDGKTVNSNGTTTLRLYYDRNQYTVSFTAQAGGTLEGVQAFGGILYETLFKDAVTVPAPRADTGYVFDGWRPALPGENFNVTKNATYTAQFARTTPDSFVVSYNANGGTGSMPSSPPIISGEAYTLSNNAFMRAGYTFAGWADAPGGGKVWNAGASITVDQDITLYAQWKQNDVPTETVPPGETPTPGGGTTPTPGGGTTPAPDSGTPGGTTPTPAPGSGITPMPETTPSPAPSSTITPVIPGTVTSQPPGPPDAGSGTTGVMTQEEQYAQIRRQTFDQMKEDGVPMVQIGDNEVPLFGLGYDTVWALLNLVLAIAGAVIAVILILGAFIRKKDKDAEETEASEETESSADIEEENPEEEDPTRKKHIGWRVTAAIAGIAGVIAFLLTENIHNLLVILVDNWTLLMVLLFIPTVVAAIVVHRKKKKEESEDEENGETTGHPHNDRHLWNNR